MALRPCTECGQMVSDKAANCQKCGATVVAPAPTRRLVQQTPPYYNPAQGQTIVVQQQSPQTNGVGTAGFVLALLGVIFCWVPILGWFLLGLGLLFSFVGVFNAPRGLAIAGFVMSLIVFLIKLFGIVAIMAIFGLLL